MFFKITTMFGVVIADELDENAPAICLDEGRVRNGCKRPRDLAPGESTNVVYPLLSRSQGGNGGELGCRVERLFDSAEHARPVVAPAVLDTTKTETSRASSASARPRSLGRVMSVPAKHVVLVFRDGEFLGSPDKGVWWDEDGARIFAAGVEYGAGTIAGGFMNGRVVAYVYPADEDEMREDESIHKRLDQIEKAVVYARERFGNA